MAPNNEARRTTRIRIKVGNVGLLWRITFIQTVVVLVAGLASGTVAATVVAIIFFISNMAILAWVDLREEE